MYHDMDSKGVIKNLNSRIEGLTEEEVAIRQSNDGKNVFPKPKRDSLLKIILNQFKNSIIIILFVAVFFSVVIGENVNAIFIAMVIIINSIIGTIQEYNARINAEKLQNLIKIKSNVIREGKVVQIDAEELVVGDIIQLETGNKVPADIRLLETGDLLVDESILSGESTEILKNTSVVEEGKKQLTYENIVYAGTSILKGRAIGIVVATGIKTELGKIAENVLNLKEEPSPLVIRINKLSKQLSIAFSVMIIIISLILYLKGFLLKDIFFSVVALTVSAIPEGLSTAMTIVLSRSSSRMAKKNVIVKNLSAVESLGSCTVIASDKTGTLTVNEQTAKAIKFISRDEIEVTGEGYNDDGIVSYDTDDKILDSQIKLLATAGVLNNEAELIKNGDTWKYNGDSIDIAFKALGEKLNINRDTLDNTSIVARIPYESDRKFSAVLYTMNDVNYLTIKGSCEKVLKFCNKMILGDKEVKIDKDEILKQNDEMASNGYRVIAIAYKKKNKLIVGDFSEEDINNLVFVGLVGFVDPLKKYVAQSVNECRKAGIKVYMITGDHPLTAYHIGKELDLVTNYDEVITGQDIEEKYNCGEKEFDEYIGKIRICARVSPLQKLMIVESLKRQGEFVAVTGDGVNDTPALKAASIGIAMGSGTDLTKDTSDMIVIDDNFTSIVEGVKEGRVAYNNIRNIIYLLLSTGLSEVILYILSIVFNFPFPMTAIQFLWLNLITNGIESNAMAFEKNADNVMEERVKSSKEDIINKLFVHETLLSACFIAAIAFSMYFYLSNILDMSIGVVRTYILLFMIFAEDIHVLNCRNEYMKAFKVPFRNNKFVISTIVISILAQPLIVYIPALRNIFSVEYIPIGHMLALFLLSFTLILVMDVFKMKIRENKN